MKTATKNIRPFTILRQVVKQLQESKKTEDMHAATECVNKIFYLYQWHQNEIKKKVTNKDFNDVNGLDFNIWAYDTEETIKRGYYRAKDKYHSLHWDKYGYNAY